MDGQSRAKLVKAGYKIFRTRDVYPISGDSQVVLEIRELSDRGQWVKYGTYLTKAERLRTLKSLANINIYLLDEEITNICEWSLDDPFEGNMWKTSCDKYFSLFDGTPEENDMNYCCFCGKSINQIIDPED